MIPARKAASVQTGCVLRGHQDTLALEQAALSPGRGSALPHGPAQRAGLQAFIGHVIALQSISKTSSKPPFLYTVYIFSKVVQENCYSLKMLLNISENNIELPFCFLCFKKIRHLHETNILKSVFDLAAVLPCAIPVLCLEHKSHFQSN